MEKREENRSQHDRGTLENEFFAPRAPSSKAFGGMPLHNFTFNIIQTFVFVGKCVCVREKEREKHLHAETPPAPPIFQ